MEDPQAQRRRHRRADQAGRLVGGRGPDRQVGDPLVAEAGAAQQRVVGVDEALVAAPVDGQGGPPAGHLGGGQVGVDVGAPEGVDGLLGIADEDEGGVAATEAELEDVPLDGVGVLELVDQRHRVAVPQLGLNAGAVHRVLQGVAQSDQEVVVGEDTGEALAPLHLLPHLDRQATVRTGPGIPRGPGGVRFDGGDGVLDRGVGHPEGVGPVEGRGRAGAVVLADVQVVDDLGDQVAGVLEDEDVALHVAGEAETAEDVLAEAMGGGDGGGVVVGQRGGEPLAPLDDLGGRAGGQQPQHVVVPGWLLTGGDPQQALLGAHQPLPHPVPQLAGGHTGKRHHQQLVERSAVGHVAGGEGGDGEGLARPGAGLEDGDARFGERSAHVEVDDGLVSHRSVTSSMARRPSHRRRA